jgi:hypothetical protein
MAGHDPRVASPLAQRAAEDFANIFTSPGRKVGRTAAMLRELECDRVPYEYKGLPVLVPRCAHDEIERLKAENQRLQRERNDLLRGRAGQP